MSSSPLVSYTKLSPSHSGKRTHAVDTITPHCVVGQVSVEALGNLFAQSSKKTSSQYGIGSDGRVGKYCEEENRSWCSSSRDNDQRAITIECASDAFAPYAFKDVVYNKLIDLCVDICKRYGKNKLIWFGDKNKTLSYTPKSNEMVLTVHRWFSSKSCPGDWMYSRMGDLATKVTSKLSGKTVSETKSDTIKASESKPNEYTIYRVQAGAFSNKKLADSLVKKLKDANFDVYTASVKGLYKVQVGAFAKKENAEALVKKLKCVGIDSFIVSSVESEVSTASKSPTKSIDTIAKEVIKGKWGNGQERVTLLTKAGYNPTEIQNRVNQLLK